MSVKVVNNVPLVINNFTVKANIFLRIAAEAVEKSAFPNTPKDTGDLRNSVVKSVLGLKGVIKWRQQHAIYQETKQFSTYTTSGTGPHFAKNAIKDVSNRTSEIAKRAGLVI